MIKVLFVCLGNICRSPMAEVVFRDLVQKENLSHKIFVDSAATGTWEIGNPPHIGTKTRLAKEGLSTANLYSRQLNSDDNDFNYILGMDNSNITNIKSILPSYNGNLSLLLEYTGENREISDPYYTGDFDTTYNDVLKGCQALLEYIKEAHL